MNVKLNLDPEMLTAIDVARRGETDVPSRAEMIRRLLGIGLAENLKRKAAKK